LLKLYSFVLERKFLEQQETRLYNFVGSSWVCLHWRNNKGWGC